MKTKIRKRIKSKMKSQIMNQFSFVGFLLFLFILIFLIAT
jgi:hypothetical protein